MSVAGPHAGQPVLAAGEPPERAVAAMVLLHGRGAGAEDILTLVPELPTAGWAFLAPQAAGGAWYPNSFRAPIESNEPWLTSALDVVAGQIGRLGDGGLPPGRVVLLGFSQGACLTAEFAFRHPRAYGGVLVLSGGLIGPPGITWNDPEGSLAGARVFLGCSDVDAHIPQERVLETEAVFKRMDATVTRRLYPGMGHLVNDDEIAFVRGVLDVVAAHPRPRRAPV